MKFLDTISDALDSLELKEFYKYIGIALGLIFCLVCFTIYRFYSSVGYYKKQIRQVNTQRAEIQELLEKASLIKKQKEEVNTILQADPYFKISSYFKDVLAQLQLSNKQVSTAKVDTREGSERDYNERMLTAQLTDMNMKEVTELLNALDQNKRVYTKQLELQKSKKRPRTLDMQLTIATLEPRIEQSAELVE